MALYISLGGPWHFLKKLILLMFFNKSQIGSSSLVFGRGPLQISADISIILTVRTPVISLGPARQLQG
jgi:hypothetical protein